MQENELVEDIEEINASVCTRECNQRLTVRS